MERQPRFQYAGAVFHVMASHLADSAAFDPDPRHNEQDRRTRKSPIESGILTLT